MLIVLVLGREKQTERWERSFCSFPTPVEYKSTPIAWYGIPRGPSTVTSLDLMWTLTAGYQKFVRSAARTTTQREDRMDTHRYPESSEPLMNVCTSSWPIPKVVIVGSVGNVVFNTKRGGRRLA